MPKVPPKSPIIETTTPESSKKPALVFPVYFESILKSYLKKNFYEKTRRSVFADRPFTDQDLRFFAQGAKELSKLFTEEREDLPANYLNDPRRRAGYLLYFFPINFCKMQGLFRKLPKEFFKRPKLRVLDLGCGPGTTALALIDFLSEFSRTEKVSRQIEIVSLDQNETVLQDARILAEAMLSELGFTKRGFNVRLDFRAVDFKRKQAVRAFPSDKQDLIVTSHFLNEWKSASIGEKTGFLEVLVREHLRSDGFCLLVEPALRRASRELMALRDSLLSEEILKVHAPCLHQEACPMLAASGRDWCHFYFAWQRPEFIEHLDRLLQNKNLFLKCAYFLLAKTEPCLSNMQEKHESKQIDLPTYRVISNRMKTKGKTEIVVCGPAGRWRLVRLDRETSATNFDFCRLYRGDRVRVLIPKEKFMYSGFLQIEKKDLLEKLDKDD